MKISSVTTKLTSRVITPKTSAGLKNTISQLHKTGGSQDFHQIMQGLYQKIEKGSSLSSKDLLLYQVKASDYFLKVELVSKAAESGASTLKKLQNAQ